MRSAAHAVLLVVWATVAGVMSDSSPFDSLMSLIDPSGIMDSVASAQADMAMGGPNVDMINDFIDMKNDMINSQPNLPIMPKRNIPMKKAFRRRFLKRLMQQRKIPTHGDFMSMFGSQTGTSAFPPNFNEFKSIISMNRPIRRRPWVYQELPTNKPNTADVSELNNGGGSNGSNTGQPTESKKEEDDDEEKQRSMQGEQKPTSTALKISQPVVDTLPVPTMPDIRGLNLDALEAFVNESLSKNDSNTASDDMILTMLENIVTDINKQLGAHEAINVNDGFKDTNSSFPHDVQERKSFVNPGNVTDHHSSYKLSSSNHEDDDLQSQNRELVRQNLDLQSQGFMQKTNVYQELSSAPKENSLPLTFKAADNKMPSTDTQQTKGDDSDEDPTNDTTAFRNVIKSISTHSTETQTYVYGSDGTSGNKNIIMKNSHNTSDDKSNPDEDSKENISSSNIPAVKKPTTPDSSSMDIDLLARTIAGEINETDDSDEFEDAFLEALREMDVGPDAITSAEGSSSDKNNSTHSSSISNDDDDDDKTSSRSETGDSSDQDRFKDGFTEEDGKSNLRTDTMRVNIDQLISNEDDDKDKEINAKYMNKQTISVADDSDETQVKDKGGDDEHSKTSSTEEGDTVTDADNDDDDSDDDSDEDSDEDSDPIDNIIYRLYYLVFALEKENVDKSMGNGRQAYGVNKSKYDSFESVSSDFAPSKQGQSHKNIVNIDDSVTQTNVLQNKGQNDLETVSDVNSVNSEVSVNDNGTTVVPELNKITQSLGDTKTSDEEDNDNKSTKQTKQKSVDDADEKVRAATDVSNTENAIAVDPIVKPADLNTADLQQAFDTEVTTETPIQTTIQQITNETTDNPSVPDNTKPKKSGSRNKRISKIKKMLKAAFAKLKKKKSNTNTTNTDSTKKGIIIFI